jgi:phage gp36-like protein
MPYTSKDELTNAIGAETLLALCDDPQVGDWTTEDVSGFSATDRLNGCISQAGRIVDGYCQAHFEVPFDTTPPLVAEIATSLALYYCYRRRRQAFGIPDSVQEEYKMTCRRLERINEGKLDLGVEPVPEASSKAVATYDGPDQLFTSETLEDF